jgi:cation diffusion facilitator CzcD-associated flavoprotein CzcO
VVVLDAQSTLGGTWAAQRLYPGLKSNNLLGTFEYPDFPMSSDIFPVSTGRHITGDAVYQYLDAYAERFGLKPLLRLETKVISATHQDTQEGGWHLVIANSKEEESKVFARRLIIATGVTSEAWLPHFDGQESFGGRIFHGKYFQQNKDTLQSARTVTVLGGGKFAWDAVYAYATAGVNINWIIRCKSACTPCADT